MGSGAPTQCGKDWIGHESDWGRHLELWRFFQSGQLVVLKGMREDWWDQSELWPPPDGWKHGQYIEIVDIVHQFTTIFELAARLGFTKAGTGLSHLEINVRGLKGRGLNISDKLMDSSYFAPFKASTDEFTCKVYVSHIELVARYQRPGLEARCRFVSTLWLGCLYRVTSGYTGLPQALHGIVNSPNASKDYILTE